jgi:hypothetical protein
VKYKIKKRGYKNRFYEKIEFYAIDKNGQRIVSAFCEVERHTSIADDSWTDWRINCPTSGAKTYEEALPYVDAIKRGMAYFKKTTKKALTK